MNNPCQSCSPTLDHNCSNCEYKPKDIYCYPKDKYLERIELMEFEGQQELIDRIEQCTNLLEIWRVLKFNRMFGLVIAELDIDDYNVKSIEYRGVDITDSIVRAIETDKGINSVFESIDRKELKKSMSIIKGGQC